MEAKDALVQWSVDQAVAWCVKNWHLLGSRSSEDAYRGARFQHNKVRDDRAQVGTGVHDTVEAEHTESWKYPVLDAEQELIMHEWRLFNEEYEVEPLLSEFTVWNFTHDYAGTADGLWKLRKRGTEKWRIVFVDLKTSNRTWPGHHMQLSALINAERLMGKTKPDAVQKKDGSWPEGSWTELPMPAFDEVALLHLRAPRFDEYGNVTEPGKHDLISVIDTDLYFEEFLGYREVLRAQRTRAEREKARYGEF